jgi:CRP-like cAMP-binding protein
VSESQYLFARAPEGALRLSELLTSRYQVTPSVAEQLRAQFSACTFREGDTVVRAGDQCPDLYFVESGLWRLFYLQQDGKEFNKAFVREDMFFVALSAHLRGEPVRFSVQALETTKALRMPYPRFAEWVEAEPVLARLWRRYMEAHFVRHEAREATLQLEDAAGRYRWFLEQHPGLIERVPLYHVASYLGMTNVTLSRVRRSFTKRPSQAAF